MSLLQRFQQSMALNGSAPACIQQGKIFGRQGFYNMVCVFSKGLHDVGVREGHTVGVALGQTTEHLAMLLAIARLGALSLPIHPMSSGDAKRQVMKRFDAKWLVTGKMPSPIPADLGFDMVDLSQLQGPVPAAGLDFLDTWPSPDAPARIALTSGTTGMPNAVLYSHAHWLSRIEKTSLSFDATTRLMPGNMSLTMGNITAFAALLAGGVVVFQKEGANSFAQTVDLYGVTHATLTPSAIPDIAAQIPSEGCAFPSLKELRFVGGALPDAWFKLAQAKFTPHIILPYGISEVGLISVASTKLLEQTPDQVGPCRPGVELQVVDPAGAVLPAGQSGELRVKIPHMPSGYYMNPERTREKFRDGWFYTSDIGSVSQDGLIRIEGRMDDRINLGGVKFFPERVEHVLNKHPLIKESAVFTIADETLGKKLVAMLVPKTAGEVAKDLKAFCQENRLNEKTPKLFVFAPNLPRNASGKVMRKNLPAILQASMKAAKTK